eukprot:3332340-Prymnesium_polylepis.1
MTWCKPTNKEQRMPNVMQWVSLYEPVTEVAFWARKSYRPSTGRRRTGSGTSAMLTDELCGGVGSRFSLREHLLSEDDP